MGAFSELFDITKADQKYGSYEEQWKDLLCLTDLYLHFAYYLQQNTKGDTTQIPYRLKGAMVSPNQLEWALQSNYQKWQSFTLSEEGIADIQQAWLYIESRIPSAINERPNIVYQLFRYLYRNTYQRICFLLAFAPKMDRKYERIIQLLQDSTEDTKPTLSLAYGITNLTADIPVSEFLIFLNDSYYWNILFDSKKEGLFTILELRECIFLRILGETGIGNELDSLVTLINNENQYDATEPAAFRKQLINKNLDLLEMAVTKGIPTVSLLTGKQGMGKFYVATEIGRQSHNDMIQIHMDYLHHIEERDVLRIFEDVAIASVINSYIPIISYESQEPDTLLYTKILEVFYSYGVVFLLTTAPKIELSIHIKEYLIMHHELERLSVLETEEMWNYHCNQAGMCFHDSVDVLELAAKYKVTPMQIAYILKTIATNHTNAPITELDIATTIREQYHGETFKYCKKIQPFFTMDDLILPTDVKNTVSYMIQRIKKNTMVNRQWGFERKYAYGKGIGILLYGRPGTGKSMCAHVIADALHLDLLKVDLASVVSKYIGETEKNLTAVFAEAERTNTILFFDEADSLFSQRTKEMGGANDKYANLETAHLLQKLEEFDGICVLTTNMAMNFDKAFFRRLEFIVNIPYPDASTRLELWNNAFPAECPKSADLSLDYISSEFELSPSEIKTIARNAAFQAVCHDSKEVTISHILDAIRMDFNKKGKSMPVLPF